MRQIMIYGAGVGEGRLLEEMRQNLDRIKLRLLSCKVGRVVN